MLSVRFALYVFDTYIDVFDGRHVYQGNMLDWGKKMSQIYRGELLHDEQVFGVFFVLINFQLSAKHFPVLPCYFMKQEDNVEKRWILKLTLNFGGGPSDATSTFLKVACADGNFLYKDDFAVVITITDN